VSPEDPDDGTAFGCGGIASGACVFGGTGSVLLVVGGGDLVVVVGGGGVVVVGGLVVVVVGTVAGVFWEVVAGNIGIGRGLRQDNIVRLGTHLVGCWHFTVNCFIGALPPFVIKYPVCTHDTLNNFSSSMQVADVIAKVSDVIVGIGGHRS